ncbi:MAG: flagellar basal body-associated FliL family protein [Rubrivivax sp.]|nr:flagellar basal body-associated FliL family protein [Rubrivivax sp.]
MTAAAAAAPDAVPRKGKKKLIVALVVGVLLLVLAGGGALWWLTKSAAGADDEDAEGGADHVGQQADPKAVPTFVPLDTFTVNLADRDGERYAQIGITLEVRDGKVADQIKAFMPAIRNNILMVLAHKTSAELLQREGKQQLAAEIRRETMRPLGVEPPAPPADAADDDAKARKAKAKAAADLPVRQVHFSNFIIQ